MKPCSFGEYVHELLKTAVYERGEDLPCIVAHAPGLPGCVTQDDNFEEARELLIDAVETWVLSALKDGIPLFHLLCAPSPQAGSPRERMDRSG